MKVEGRKISGEIIAGMERFWIEGKVLPDGTVSAYGSGNWHAVRMEGKFEDGIAAGLFVINGEVGHCEGDWSLTRD